ncbi:MAG: LysR family transcriptional regulator [Candidatus Limnocylindrales bacterium]
MELRVLRYFLAVADEASLTRAAMVVSVAQPSLSRQIRGLEASLGQALFDRSDGRLRLTPAGRQFVPLARDVVARADAAAAAMRDPESSRGTRLSLVAPHVTIVDVIAPYLATLGSQALSVSVRDAPSLAVFRIIRSGDADLGVSVGPPPGELASLPVAHFSITAQVPEGHPWAGRKRVGLAELVTEPLVLLTTEHGTRRVFDQAVAAAGLSYHAVAEAGLSAVAQTLAVGGAGVAVVSDDASYGLQPMLVDVGEEVLSIPIVAAWEGSHFAAPMLEAWARRLAEYTRIRYAGDVGVGPDDSRISGVPRVRPGIVA